MKTIEKQVLKYIQKYFDRNNINKVATLKDAMKINGFIRKNPRTDILYNRDLLMVVIR